MVALATAGVTFVVAIAALVALLVGHQRSGSWFSSGDGAAVPDQQVRSRVIATAEQFCLRVDGFDGSDPDGYQKSVTQMLTTKYKAAFDTQFEQIEKLGIQAGQKGKGTIVASGIADIDDDSASVLVVHDNAITESGKATTQRHSRWTISLVKVGGKWLVDDFTPAS